MKITRKQVVRVWNHYICPAINIGLCALAIMAMLYIMVVGVFLLDGNGVGYGI